VAEDDQCGFVGLGFRLLQDSAFAITGWRRLQRESNFVQAQVVFSFCGGQQTSIMAARAI